MQALARYSSSETSFYARVVSLRKSSTSVEGLHIRMFSSVLRSKLGRVSSRSHVQSDILVVATVKARIVKNFFSSRCSGSSPGATFYKGNLPLTIRGYTYASPQLTFRFLSMVQMRRNEVNPSLAQYCYSSSITRVELYSMYCVASKVITLSTVSRAFLNLLLTCLYLPLHSMYLGSSMNRITVKTLTDQTIVLRRLFYFVATSEG